MGIFSVMIIADGVVPPIRMSPFPAVEAFQAVRSGDKPDIAGAQVEILVPDQADVFNAVPGVSLGNHGRLNDDGCRNHHRRRYDNRRYIKPHLTIRLNDTT